MVVFQRPKCRITLSQSIKLHCLPHFVLHLFNIFLSTSNGIGLQLFWSDVINLTCLRFQIFNFFCFLSSCHNKISGSGSIFKMRSLRPRINSTLYQNVYGKQSNFPKKKIRKKTNHILFSCLKGQDRSRINTAELPSRWPKKLPQIYTCTINDIWKRVWPIGGRSLLRPKTINPTDPFSKRSSENSFFYSAVLFNKTEQKYTHHNRWNTKKWHFRSKAGQYIGT